MRHAKYHLLEHGDMVFPGHPAESENALVEVADLRKPICELRQTSHPPFDEIDRPFLTPLFSFPSPVSAPYLFEEFAKVLPHICHDPLWHEVQELRKRRCVDTALGHFNVPVRVPDRENRESVHQGCDSGVCAIPFVSSLLPHSEYLLHYCFVRLVGPWHEEVSQSVPLFCQCRD